MAVLDAIDTPESALRKRLNRRGTALGMPLEVPDPVYGQPESVAPLPVVGPPTTGGPDYGTVKVPATSMPFDAPFPTPAVASQPLTFPKGMTTPGIENRYTTNAARAEDGERREPGGPGRPEPPGQTAPTMPTGPVTSDDDPRLTDPRYGSDPDVLAWLNRPGGPGDTGPKNGDYKTWIQAVLAGKPYNQASLLSVEWLLNRYGVKIEPANALGERTKIRLPNGQVVRVGFGEPGWAWVVQPPPGSGGAGGAVPVPGGQSQFQDALRKILMERLAKAQQPVDENDPYISQPYAAAATAATRQQQQERTALAERLAATGDTSRSLEMGIQQSAERNAIGLGSLKAKLVQDEYSQRRQELLDLMQMAIATNDAQAARDIQAAMIALDRAKFEVGYNDRAGG